MSFAAMMLVASLLDMAIGWPERLYARIGHPVTWIGALISALEARLNTGQPARRLATGAGVTLGVVLLVGGIAAALQAALPSGLWGVLLGGVLAWPLVALRSMHQHVAAVVTPLVAGDLAQARQAVSMIVGRDPSALDDAGVARAALESLAENTSDGIVAPVFWGMVAGLPGIAAYKAINTMDSMIGHRNARYEHFGKAAARLDDLANLVPARLTGLFFALLSAGRGRAFRIMWRDAGKHRSPNAGWPEAAMAGGLNRRLSGPRVYGDQIAAEPWLNAGSPDPAPQDLARGLALYRRAMAAMIGVLAVLALAGG
ncbi:adenosylcobinamide-phosphate synthase CbiB [Roseibaca sp. Y0-43]|uniref:adenosylcobinamide-phosphate synthase CbiB n=1 Tax=Roseibaca sp. Y0-43 TaxID=2816854 RepID=UPI001D0CA391|nr:adenosylcobinamide-phosphate synthase CbiB [Roseibaca sp. Y0-43]MCC1482675.1 cobalamin biosynthesis protein CobD [Roseibaca sp. Y0-43]